MDAIENADIRQQYKDCAEQSRLKMFDLYLKTTEEQKHRCQKMFQSEEKKMWMDRRVAAENDKMPLIMINLIEQRCKRISDGIKCSYHYKGQSLGTSVHL